MTASLRIVLAIGSLALAACRPFSYHGARCHADADCKGGGLICGRHANDSTGGDRCIYPWERYDADAGADAGSDAGADAGDAGAVADAGADGGADAGTDAGADAGADGGADAGADAGPDAGAPAKPCASPTAYSLSLDGGIGPDAGDFVRSWTSPDSGVCLAWATRDIGYEIGSNGSDNMTPETAQQAIRDSFASWSKQSITACTSELTFSDLGTNASPVLNGTDRVNNVFWIESGWTSEPGHSAAAIALTTNSFYASTGEIIDSDMEFNGQYFTFTIADGGCAGKQDIQNTATHEIGHLIGLDHSTNPEATMYQPAPSCETKKRSLHSGDMFGVCQVYGPGQ